MSGGGLGSTGVAAAAAAFNTAASDIANPVTHSALDFFEKPSVLINYECSFDQEVFPQVGASGPTLDFVVCGDNRNCIDLNYIHLGITAAIYNADGRDKVKADDASKVIFSNNTLHSLFSQVELYLNGVLISDSNNTYHHRSFIETELTTNDDSKKTWAECQGYCYNPDPEDARKTLEWSANRLKRTLNADYRQCFYGALYVDFFTCERLLLPNVTMRVKLYRAASEFSLTSLADDADKNFCAVIEKASLFVRKVTVTESVKVSIERALLKSPARYPYVESLCKSFIIQTGQNSFVKESIFGTEPIRRLTLCMVANKDFRGSRASDPFHYKKYDMSRVELLRGNGVPIAGTPVDTRDNARIYHNSLSALGFKNGGNGIALDDFCDHFVLVFDLTSSQEASKTLTVFPELTGAPLTLKLFFEKQLPEPVELYLIGEKFSQVFVNSDRNISKNQLIFYG